MHYGSLPSSYSNEYPLKLYPCHLEVALKQGNLSMVQFIATYLYTIFPGFEFLKPVILSGGLTPDNVRDAIEELSPYGVDVSSGVEISPGKKDISLVKKFVDNVRRA